jgi:hypothetical protein
MASSTSSPEPGRSAIGQKRVVGERPAVAEEHAVLGVVDRGDQCADEPCVDAQRGLREGCLARIAEGERLRDRGGAADEFGGGRDQRQRDAIARQRPQREQRLEAGDATARDEDSMRLASHDPAWTRPGSR